MSRLIFEARRRVPPPSTRKGTITIEAPPELPRVIPPSLLRRAMPYLIVILIVGMIVALVATGMRVISPQTLFFPFVLLLAATALYRGNDNKMRTEEVDAERADYLRYLSVVRDNIRTQAAEQRAAAQWSHPDPATLASVPGSRRQWERDPHDSDFLLLRAGRHHVPLATTLRVNDTADEIDLEPVSHSALRSLLDTQRTVRDVPTGIDLTKVSRITVLGEPDEVRAALRAWIAQAVTWHDPTVLGVALAARDLEGRDWSWLKWLPHIDIPGQIDGVGPARYLTTDPDELVSLLGPALEDRPPFTGGPADALRHLLIVVDDPDYEIDASTLAAARAGVTVVHCSATAPHREQYSDPEKPILRIARGAIQRWQTGGWLPYIDAADRLGADEAAHLARRLSRWDSNPTHAGLRSEATRGATFPTLLGIPDASQLDVPALWAPRRRDDELRVPIGVTATGEPLMFDLKDEAEGGMGPHGLMIGMTGSGKSQTLMSILLSLLTTHSADRLIVIYADFKGEAGADSFRNFPQVVAVISNMAEKKSLADRFADTLRGEVARREVLLREAGRQVQGSAFNSVTEYENAIAAGTRSAADPDAVRGRRRVHPDAGGSPGIRGAVRLRGTQGPLVPDPHPVRVPDAGCRQDQRHRQEHLLPDRVEGGQPQRFPSDHRRGGCLPHRIRQRAQGLGLLGARPRRDADQVPQHLCRWHLRASANSENPCRAIYSGAEAIHRRSGGVGAGHADIRRCGRRIGRSAAQADRDHRRTAGALRAASPAAVAAAARRADPADHCAGPGRDTATALALAARRDRQAIRDAPRSAGVRRVVVVREHGDPRWRQIG